MSSDITRDKNMIVQGFKKKGLSKEVMELINYDADYGLTREQIAFFIYRFRKFDVTKREQRQRLIDSFVNAVYLYEDKIILTFNYKDGSKTITLAEVEGSDLSVLGAPTEEHLCYTGAFLFMPRGDVAG